MTGVIRASEIIANARLTHTMCERLPEDCRPYDEDMAYAIQDAISAELMKHYGRITGYKVGLVTEKMRLDMGGRKRLGIDQPACGPIFAAYTFESPAVVRRDHFYQLYVEGEFAVRIGKDLPPRSKPYSKGDVGAHVSSCFAGIELVDWRIAYFGDDGPAAPLMIADNGANSGAVVGTGTSDWLKLDLENVAAHLEVNGERVASGRSSDLLGHPFNVLSWLANRMNALGKSLCEGDLVLLGSVTPSHAIKGTSADVAVIWEGMGEARVRVE
jgi:2-keto-4-pentenoate hydratase